MDDKCRRCPARQTCKELNEDGIIDITCEEVIEVHKTWNKEDKGDAE